MPRMHDEETPLLRSSDDSHDDHDVRYDSPQLTASSSTATLAATATAVASSSSSKPVREETPLPWAQFSLVLFLQLAEPLTSQVIYPFVPEVRLPVHSFTEPTC